MRCWLKRVFMTNGLACLCAALAFAVSGCNNEPPSPPSKSAAAPLPSLVAPPAVSGLTVDVITLGKGIGVDKKIIEPLDIYARTDAIFVAVETTGMGEANIKAKWTFHGDKKAADVGESIEILYATGPTVSSFPLSKPTSWPPGDYHVEIFLDDKLAGIKNFTVK